MKKFATLIVLMATLTIAASAQYTTPRTGTGPGRDNTYRVLNYAYFAPPADHAGLDTIIVTPTAFHTQLSVGPVLDSVAISVPSVANSHVGDELDIQVVNSSTGKVIRWAGPYFATATVTTGSQNGALYLTASKRATIVFHFDGVKWVEYSRMAQ